MTRSIKKPLEKIKNINSPGDIKSIPEMEQINSITDHVSEVKEAVGTEKMGETVENKAKSLKGVKVLEEQKGELEHAIPDFDKLNDSEHYKEELINTAKEKAVDHFAGHADKLQAAQSKLADVKKKYPEGVSSIKDLPKIRSNGMKGKPFKERLVLGLTVQVHPDKIPNVDLSPFAAYKISKRLSFGLGGSYRLIAKPEFKGIYTEGAVYGYRGFTEFMLHKGIFVHAEYEMLKTQVRDSIMFNTLETALEKDWIDGLLLGIGKEYKIGGMVKGNMQVLYNFLDEANSPYQNKIMVRFGFSFQLKDKIKKPDLTPKADRLKEQGKRSSSRLMKENLMKR